MFITFTENGHFCQAQFQFASTNLIKQELRFTNVSSGFGTVKDIKKTINVLHKQWEGGSPIV